MHNAITLSLPRVMVNSFILRLRAERDEINEQITCLEAGLKTAPIGTGTTVTHGKTRKKRAMSPTAKKNIALGQQKRRAKTTPAPVEVPEKAMGAGGGAPTT